MIGDIADAIRTGLQAKAADYDLEQAVHGLDSLDELCIHAILWESLHSVGFGTYQEQRYPSDRKRRRKSEGKRCDIVLTHDAKPILDPSAQATLFEPPDAVALSDAFWLEVKVVSQHSEDGPNQRYTSALLEPVRRDVSKLAKDRDILHAGVLLVLCVADEQTGIHDLNVWHEQAINKGIPVGFPAKRSFAISNRIGNAICMIAVFPVHHL